MFSTIEAIREFKIGRLACTDRKRNEFNRNQRMKRSWNRNFLNINECDNPGLHEAFYFLRKRVSLLIRMRPVFLFWVSVRSPRGIHLTVTETRHMHIEAIFLNGVICFEKLREHHNKKGNCYPSWWFVSFSCELSLSTFWAGCPALSPTRFNGSRKTSGQKSLPTTPRLSFPEFRLWSTLTAPWPSRIPRSSFSICWSASISTVRGTKNSRKRATKGCEPAAVAAGIHFCEHRFPFCDRYRVAWRERPDIS